MSIPLASQQQHITSSSSPTHSLQSQSFYIPLLAGGTSGIISTTLLQPFDVLKTTMINPIYQSQSMSHISRDIIHHEGVTGLWRGITPAILRIAIGSSLYFSIQTQLLQSIQLYQLNNNVTIDDKSNNQLINKTKYLFVGGVSRGIAVALACPISVIKTRYEGISRGNKQYTSIYNALYTISRTEGIRGMYAGVVPSVIKDAPYAAVYLYLYTSIKSILYNTIHINNTNNYNNIIIQFSGGFIAGGLATALFQPFEVIKTRKQLNTKLSLNTFNMFTYIYTQHGVHGLYRGLLPRVLRRSMSNALSWMLFEQIVTFYSGFTGL